MTKLRHTRPRIRRAVEVTLDEALLSEVRATAHRHGLALSELVELVLRHTVQHAPRARPSGRRPIVCVSRRAARRRLTRHITYARDHQRPVLLRGMPSPGIGRGIRGHRLTPYAPRFRALFALEPVAPFPPPRRRVRRASPGRST